MSAAIVPLFATILVVAGLVGSQLKSNKFQLNWLVNYALMLASV